MRFLLSSKRVDPDMSTRAEQRGRQWLASSMAGLTHQPRKMFKGKANCWPGDNHSCGTFDVYHLAGALAFAQWLDVPRFGFCAIIVSDSHHMAYNWTAEDTSRLMRKNCGRDTIKQRRRQYLTLIVHRAVLMSIAVGSTIASTLKSPIAGVNS